MTPTDGNTIILVDRRTAGSTNLERGYTQAQAHREAEAGMCKALSIALETIGRLADKSIVPAETLPKMFEKLTKERHET
jgi:hypothetical protein